MKNLEIIKSIQEINNQPLSITIGNFDGVHLGHQDFLNYIKNDAVKNNLKLLVITFIPHPAFVLKAQPHYLLNTYNERRTLLANAKVDYLLELDFTRDFSTLTPEEFLDKFVFSSKNVKKIFLGYDFHFGANKSGNFELAKSQAVRRGVELIVHSEYKVSTDAVSSSRIRNLIRSGEVGEVPALLGRNYFLCGRVIKGEGRGRQIGFPTANLGYDLNMIMPSNGVYITRTRLSNMTYESVTNVGVNPTFTDGYEIHVETHLLGFSRDIYGEEMSVEFVKKIRDEKKFASVNELVTQIGIDVENVKKYFKND